MAAEGPVVTGARRGIRAAPARQEERLRHGVRLAPHAGNGGLRLVAEVLQCAEVVARDVLAVGVAGDPSGAVPGRVGEVLRRCRRLVGVVAPGVEDRAAVGVQVDEAADLRILLEEPPHVPVLGFGERRRAVEQVVAGIGRGERSRSLRRRGERRLEVPQEVVVPVDVDTDAAGDAAAAGRVPVLAPHREHGLAVVTAVGIDIREDDELDVVDDRGDVGGGVGHAAVDEPGTRGPRLEQVGRQVDQDVGAAPLPGVRATDEQDAVVAGTSRRRSAARGCAGPRP